MRIAIIGAGNVGTALATGWARAGHAIVYGVIDPAAKAATGAAGVARVGEAAAAAEVIVLAVPWAAVPDAIAACGDLTGKIVIDATNPLAFTDGTLALTLGFSTSGGEEVARLAPGAAVFKTMNQVGFAVMPDATGYPAPAVMFVAGDDAARKPVVIGLVAELGFEPRDAGPLDRARLLEPYALVWIEQATLHGAGDRRAFGLMQKDATP